MKRGMVKYLSLGTSMKEFRKNKLGITQEELAKTIGCCVSTLVNSETGRQITPVIIAAYLIAGWRPDESIIKETYRVLQIELRELNDNRKNRRNS